VTAVVNSIARISAAVTAHLLGLKSVAKLYFAACRARRAQRTAVRIRIGSVVGVGARLHVLETFGCEFSDIFSIFLIVRWMK
jgi:hypothetical protein